MEEERPQIGGRIRRLRRQRRIAQADLAAAIGISPSYLNLIEFNRRSVTVPVLFAIAGHFGIEPGELAATDEARLGGDLMELFGDDLFADSELTNHDIREFAAGHPAVARAVMHLFDRYRHLKDTAPLPPAEVSGEPFHRATDAVSDFLQEQANHFPALEDAAERVRQDVDSCADDFPTGLRTYLQNVFGLEWRVASLPHGIARRLGSGGNRLDISDTLAPESAQFAVAHHLAGLTAGREIDAILEEANLPEGDAEALARNTLSAYFAAALIMPYGPFLGACLTTRYDIDRIARRFGASFEQVCHRMTTLQRSGARGVPLHLVRADIAGNISKRFSLSGIRIPRHAGACPRWNVHTAFLQPGRINVQLSRMPDGQTFFCVARSFEKGGVRHNAPRRHFSIGLGCDIAHARSLIYADGVDLENEAGIVPVGTSCRICPRRECEQRAHPPADHRFDLPADLKPESLYGRM